MVEGLLLYLMGSPFGLQLVHLDVRLKRQPLKDLAIAEVLAPGLFGSLNTRAFFGFMES